MEISEINPDGNVYNIKDATARNTITLIQSQFGYSTTEKKTNETWIDSKPIYRKVVNFGTLPNTTTKSVSHGITNYAKMVSIKGIAINQGAGNTIPLPYVVTNGEICQLYVKNENVIVVSNSDYSEYTQAYVILEYTKTTD